MTASVPGIVFARHTDDIVILANWAPEGRQLQLPSANPLPIK